MSICKYSRNELADKILDSLIKAKDKIVAQWNDSKDQINYFYLDDLLPEDIALDIREAFPSNVDSLKLKKSLRELKFIGVQMDQYNPLLEEIIFAFQDKRVIEFIEMATGLKHLNGDSFLYAGGISMMVKNHFLNPHLDNSHDKNKVMYRMLNLLYYVSPNWKLSNGGNLELWPDGPTKEQITIESKFNRLVVMFTSPHSWHSVSKVMVNEMRCCVSNYYFSNTPPTQTGAFHVTSFRGRPEQKIRDFILRADIFLRMAIRKVFPKGIVKNKHFYKK